MAKPSVAVAIPAYNEADGIAGFLQEIDKALTPHVEALRLVVVDDASTDGTAVAVRAAAPRLAATVEVVSGSQNRGHGPSLMAAYRMALDGDPDYVLQVDGDGQFHGGDLRRVVVLLMDDAHAVSGVRRFRVDPWFRMTMSRLVRHYVSVAFGVAARDPNCPLRGYEATLLRQLLTELPADCPIPNLYLTILACRRGVPLLEVDVSHRVRRGVGAQGTMWRRGGYSPVPIRLVRFSATALLDSLRFRRGLGVEGAVEATGTGRPVPFVTEAAPERKPSGVDGDSG